MKILLLILVLSFAAFGQTNSISIHVKMSVESDDAVLQKTLYNALLKELGSVKDIKLVTDKEGHSYWLDVWIIKILSKNKTLFGYAISVAITSTHHGRPLVETENNKNEIKSYDDLIVHDVVTIDQSSIVYGAKNIAQLFDTVISPEREFMKKLDLNNIKKGN